MVEHVSAAQTEIQYNTAATLFMFLCCVQGLSENTAGSALIL